MHHKFVTRRHLVGGQIVFTHHKTGGGLLKMVRHQGRPIVVSSQSQALDGEMRTMIEPRQVKRGGQARPSERSGNKPQQGDELLDQINRAFASIKRRS